MNRSESLFVTCLLFISVTLLLWFFAPKKAILPLNEKDVEESRILIYNKIPKTGSTTFLRVIQSVAVQKRYKVVHIQPQTIWRSNETELLNLIKPQEKVLGKYFVRHFHFVPFQGFKYVYFNSFRDPIRRLESRFYYARKNVGRIHFSRVFPQFQPGAIANLTYSEWFKGSFEECLLKGKRECVPKKGETVDNQIVNRL